MHALRKLTIIIVFIFTLISYICTFPTDESRYKRGLISHEVNKSEDNIGEFIQRARENIKIRDFLQNFDVTKSIKISKDVTSNLNDEQGNHYATKRRRRRSNNLLNSEPKPLMTRISTNDTSSSDIYTSRPSTKNEASNTIESSASDKNTNAETKDVKISKVFVDDGSMLEVRSCVHKYGNVARTLGQKSDFNYEYDGTDDMDYNDKDPVLSNITLSGIGEVQVEHCARAKFCYALWSQAEDGSVAILGQGCWESWDVKQTCSQTECRSDNTSKSNTLTYFCCCKTDLCNAAPVTSAMVKDLTTSDKNGVILSTESTFKASNYGVSVCIAVACLGGVILTVVTRLFCKHLKGGSHKDVNNTGADSVNLVEAGGPGFSCSNMCVDNLKLHDNIGEGKHGKVWRGSLGGVPVAVKAMPACNMSLWSRERDIYCLPHMTHPNLLAYFGCDSRSTLDGSIEHLLVLQLAPLGSLKQYLIDHTLDWDSYTKMALGVASALAHLHTQIDLNDEYKPCIVHRDVNSSNILVRADHSCCLSDLGLAMALPDSRKKTQQPKIQEAGTLRYLAPEALEGALDLRRCDAALKAVDIYALALVLWELLSRCAPAHRPPGPHNYAPPYHAEVGDHPSLEQMQVIVARRKARPLFSARLLNTRAARLAKDTCEDCWDHDAEARLTALCVVERLTELRNLKPVPSPTINNNDLRPPNDISFTHSPGSVEDKNSNLLSSVANNSVITSIFDFDSLQSQPIQPHQGRNPCLERNLASAGPCDRLIDKSMKDMTSNSTSSSSGHGYGSNDFRRLEQSFTETTVRNEEPQDFSRIEDHLQNTSRNVNRAPLQNVSSNTNSDANDELTPGDYRLLTRPVTPIGYVQNDVSGENSGSAGRKDQIKQTNIKMDHSNKWTARNFKKLLDSKLFKRRSQTSNPIPLETEVNLVLANGKPINKDSMAAGGFVRTSVIVNDVRSREGRNELKQNSSRNVDNIVDRPSSLPGLDAINSSGSRESTSSAMDTWKNISNINVNNTCTLSPPNQTISMAMLRQNCSENLIGGYKELPSGLSGGNSSHQQVFAVIVPKATVNTNNGNLNCESESTDWKNKKILLNHSKPHKNIISHSNNTDSSKRSNETDSSTYVSVSGSGSGPSKRHSCDEKVLLPGGGKLDNVIFKDVSSSHQSSNKYPTNRNSYSGEYEVGGLSVMENSENFDPNMMDYSSNSEDEHMLLLSENGGSKITMRPRFDMKSNENKNKKKTKNNSGISIPGSNSSLSKITAGSFTSICNKYGPKSKYENFQNENLLDKQSNCTATSIEDLRKKSAVIDRNDVSIINLARNGSVLSLCKNKCDDDLSDKMNSDHLRGSQDLNFNETNDFIVNNRNEEDSDSYSDDSTLRDSVSLQENRIPRPLSIKDNLSRQHSLELVSDLFSSSGDLSRLKDPANRIKTPGDVPASVRRVRGHKRAISMNTKAKPNPLNRLSLYDDRIMFGNSL